LTMPNKQRRIILFIGLISAAILLKTAAAAEMSMPEIPPGAGKQEAPQQGAGKQSAPQTTGKIEYKAEGLRDPFEEEKIEIKDEGPAKPLPPLQVTAIVWGGVIPQAIINDEVVKVGDMIEGVRIIDIKNNSITVFFDNRKHNITTSSPLQKQDSKGNPQGINREGINQ